jgi:glutathione S-transferase
VPVENLVVVVTLASLLFYFWTCARVASARARNKILAPAVTGHPEFERASDGATGNRRRTTRRLGMLS